MNRMRVILTSILLLLVFTGCGNFNFSFTSAGGKTKIEVNNVADGETAEYQVINVSKGKSVSVESELEKGQLKIDFAETVNMKTSVDDMDDYVTGDIVSTITVGAGGSGTVSLDPGEYSLLVTAIGETNGTVTVNVRKD